MILTLPGEDIGGSVVGLY